MLEKWRSHRFTEYLNWCFSLPGRGSMKSVIQGFPDWRRSWKKETAVSKASVVADEQMVNCSAFMISIYQKRTNLAPDLANQLFGHRPGERSRPLFPQLLTPGLQAHCLSPSMMMWLWVDEQGGRDLSTVSWRQFWKLTVGHFGLKIISIYIHLKFVERSKILSDKFYLH